MVSNTTKCSYSEVPKVAIYSPNSSKLKGNLDLARMTCNILCTWQGFLIVFIVWKMYHSLSNRFNPFCLRNWFQNHNSVMKEVRLQRHKGVDCIFVNKTKTSLKMPFKYSLIALCGKDFSYIKQQCSGWVRFLLEARTLNDPGQQLGYLKLVMKISLFISPVCGFKSTGKPKHFRTT